MASVITAYYNLKSDITGVKNEQYTENRIYDMRLKILESRVTLLQTEVQEMKVQENNKENKR